jgi:hypothetical protein
MIQEAPVATYIMKKLKNMHEPDGNEFCAATLTIHRMIAFEIDDNKDCSDKILGSFPLEILLAMPIITILEVEDPVGPES